MLKSLLNSFYTVGIQVHITDVQVHFWVYLNVCDFQSPTFRYRGVPERLITIFVVVLFRVRGMTNKIPVVFTVDPEVDFNTAI